ncbi:unnamed protein product, partial [Sphacelaria rigidula]
QVDCFEDNPGILMYGMMCVVYTTGLWLLLASWLELPVSTTHSTVGGIVGMAMAYRGADCVLWHEDTNTFPFVGGISSIVASWALSPVFSGCFSVALFLFVRTFVLRSENSYNRSYYVFPLLVVATVAVNVFFIVYKGASGLDLDDTSISTAFIWAFSLGVGLGLLMIPTVLPYIRRNVENVFNEDGTRRAVSTMECIPIRNIRAIIHGTSQVQTGVFGYVNRQLNQDIHASIKDSEYVSSIHDNAEKFDPRAEEVFKYVQVFTAICDSFSHGANDVANAMGPFAAIYATYVNGGVDSESDLGDDAFWILALGGAGIVVGLALYGYKIISAIGVKIAKITPSRGFAIELGSAMMVIIGSRLEIPLSTTHCQVGSTTGVALLEGTGGVNYTVLGKTVMGWVLTIVICALTCALIFSLGAYAPYVFDTIDVVAESTSAS